MRNLSEIINRIKQKFELKSDTQVAKLLNVEQNTLSSWKKRDKIPYEKLDELALNNNISIEWILSGKERDSKYDELINNFELLNEEKKEIYLLRIKADAIEDKLS